MPDEYGSVTPSTAAAATAASDPTATGALTGADVVSAITGTGPAKVNAAMTATTVPLAKERRRMAITPSKEPTRARRLCQPTPDSATPDAIRRLTERAVGAAAGGCRPGPQAARIASAGRGPGGKLSGCSSVLGCDLRERLRHADGELRTHTYRRPVPQCR